MRDDLVEQFHAIAQLSHDVNVALALIHFVEAHDVRVIQVLQDFDLVLKTHLLLLVKSELVDNLDGTLLSSVVSNRDLHLTVGTRTNHLLHRVVFLEDFDVFVFDDEVFALGDDIVLALEGSLLLHGLETLLASRIRSALRFGSCTAHLTHL